MDPVTCRAVSLLNRIDAALDGLRKENLERRLVPSLAQSFSHNDYLGLRGHPEIVAAGLRALRSGATGSGGSRLLGGHSIWFEQCEAAISEFFSAPSALFFSSGYLANLALIQALRPFFNTIVSDERNHASLIDGMRLAKIPRCIVPHRQWHRALVGTERPRLWIAESLYSMDGDCQPLDELMRFADERDDFVVLDESHAAGVFGEQGRGLSEQSRDWGKMAVVVTFGKAFGVGGAAILCGPKLRHWILNTARSFIYTTASPPVVPAMVTASLSVMHDLGAELRNELWERAERCRKILIEGGCPVDEPKSFWEWRSPILAFHVPGEDRALSFCRLMRDFSELRAIRYPTVPRGSERVRISLNLSATRSETFAMAEGVVEIWKAFSSRVQTPT